MSTEIPDFDSQQEKPMKDIKEAESFDELYEILSSRGEIPISGKTATFKEIKHNIEMLRAPYGATGLLPDEVIKYITKTDGLRERVIYLYNKEVEERKAKGIKGWNE